MKGFFLMLVFFAASASFAQRSIPFGIIQAIESRMTDLESSLFLVDSLYREYLNGGWLTIQDGSKSDLYESGSSWLYNHYTALGKEYPKQCSECKTKADEVMQLIDKESKTEENIAYRKILQKADDYFREHNYIKAKEYYQRAVNFMPSDPYPKQKLKEIDEICSKQPETK